jgi:ribosomal protein S18 acetylase RimI-like enzyme
MMSTNQQLRLLQKSDISRVADIHCLIFPTSRSTRLGKLYVRKMFYWFLEKQPALSFVFESNGEIVGYLIGAIGGYGRKLFRYALFEIVLGLMTHPGLWLRRDTFMLWHSYLQSLNPAVWMAERRQNERQHAIPLPVKRAALAGIGIIPEMRGRGISKLMVQAFEQAAISQGASLLGLSVEIDNLPARHLYEKCGWKLDASQTELKSMHYSKELR